MAELSEIYQEIILDHSRNPRNCFALDAPDRVGEGYNALCGDRCTVYVKFGDARVSQISFVHEGCAISAASASIMTEAAAGKTTSEALNLVGEVNQALNGEGTCSSNDNVVALAGVKAFPMRVQCALLPWKTLEAALNSQAEAITTQ